MPVSGVNYFSCTWAFVDVYRSCRFFNRGYWEIIVRFLTPGWRNDTLWNVKQYSGGKKQKRNRTIIAPVISNSCVIIFYFSFRFHIANYEKRSWRNSFFRRFKVLTWIIIMLDNNVKSPWFSFAQHATVIKRFIIVRAKKSIIFSSYWQWWKRDYSTKIYILYIVVYNI